MRSNILVVDDTAINLLLVSETLKDEYAVQTASSGPEALELARTTLPDLVLLDVGMAGMDGYEVCARLKADPATRDIPVIFLTGMTDVEAETRGFEIGGVDYIHKPPSPAIVKARIATQLGLLRAQRRVNDLLESLLPAAALTELKATGKVEPRLHESVAVLFCDLAGFTDYCARHEPEVVVAELAGLFVEFERCAERHGLEKIKTIGDCFVATANLLRPVDEPLERAVRCGLDIARALEPRGWQTHGGAHLGPLMAGVVGRERYQYDIWGDTVNLAARLCATASPGRVAIAEEMVGKFPAAECTSLGEVVLKGKGPVRIAEVQ